MDARGQDSQWAPDGDYGIDALVADGTSIIGELREKPVLVGASMGGMTSLIGQGENPDLARGLVLVDIAPKIETAGTAEIMAFMRSGLENPLAKRTRSCATNARGTPWPRSPFRRCSFVASSRMWSAGKDPRNCSS
ncbi:alpha/beta hydrolase [Rhodococcus sp. FXJ9.536]|uniref:Alpha/beta hydrolase n=1 Tax=Rhodococcus tibetensis TaxID=2965064 RepID=A0ABT1Q9J0_9NOCA|nr:alpha/beta hydrolase [Rhodococcus sp. FXJ9.536]MCQ4118348.1 alpha/beta hydrolase [Rhodococcus sp. FXJ9.536]